MATSMLLLLILKTHIRQCILQTKWEINKCKNVVVVSRKIAEVYFKSHRLLFFTEHEHFSEMYNLLNKATLLLRRQIKKKI